VAPAVNTAALACLHEAVDDDEGVGDLFGAKR
jgi:hypothetical protein